MSVITIFKSIILTEVFKTRVWFDILVLLYFPRTHILYKITVLDCLRPRTK